MLNYIRENIDNAQEQAKQKISLTLENMKFKKYIVILVLTITTIPLFSQNSYKREISGINYESMLKLSDSEIILCGQKKDSLILSTWLINSGAEVWNRTYNIFMSPKMIITAPNNCFALIGTKENTLSYLDIYVILFDSNFDTLWTKSIGGSYGDFGFSLLTSKDNKLISLGNAYNGEINQTIINKLDLEGNIEWECRIDSLSRPTKAIQNMDSSYVFASSYFNSNFCFTKIDKNGIFQWSKIYDNTYQLDNFNNYSDTSYLLIGRTDGSEIDSVKTIHVNSNGEIIWSNLYSTIGYDGGTNVIRNNDNEIICLGWSGASPYSSNLIAYSLDAQGNQLITENITNDIGREYGIDIFQTNDNGYLILARKETYEVINDNLVLTSYSSLLIKTNSLFEVNSTIEINNESIKIYPNPVHDFLFFDFSKSSNEPKTLSLYDQNGKKICQTIIDENEYLLDVKNLKGTFIVELIFNNNRYSRKVIIE